MRKGALAGALLVGWLWALRVTAGAEPAAGQVDLNADQRSLVIQLTAERAVTLAREHRLADEAQKRFYEQLAAKDQALRASQAASPATPPSSRGCAKRATRSPGSARS